MGFAFISQRLRGGFLIFKNLLKAYLVESTISVRAVKILDGIILGKIATQKGLGDMERRWFLLGFRGGFDAVLLMSRL